MTTSLVQARRVLSTSLVATLLAGCVVDAPDDAVAEEGADGGHVAWVGEPAMAEPRENPEAVVGDPIAVEPQVVEHEGDVCLYANDAPLFPGIQQQTELEEGDVLVVQVTLPRCLSSSCSMDRTASCRIHRDGRRLLIESSFSYVPIDAATCTKDCIKLFATCESEPLAAGTYELVYGDQALGLPVPSTGDACLVDEMVDAPREHP